MKLWIIAAACSLLQATPVAHAEPVITLERTSVAPGQTVAVRLTGWAAGNVLVELCGNEARRGTADCAIGSSAGTHVQEGKTALVLLTVTAPPVGCPCVIAVRPVTGGSPRTVPISVKGVPKLSPGERPTATSLAGTRRLTATRVAVRGGGPGEAWFGGSASRTLRVTLRNEGTVTLTDPPLSLTAGRGPEPADLVTAPALGTLQPGQERTYDIPFTLPAPAFGRYTVRGEITGLDEPITFTAATASYPWALPLLGLLLVPVPWLTRRRPVTAPGVAQSGSMNRTVAANVAWWAQARGLSGDDLAKGLAAHTGRSRDPADLPPASPDCSLDADDLLALSRILDVPLAALFLPAAPATADRSSG
ncbi:MAG TPA: hypothetical protein VHJ17_01160 [Thermomonospora sp.]|nr:hypothetical protein [Thermomonospora sp.]